MEEPRRDTPHRTQGPVLHDDLRRLLLVRLPTGVHHRALPSLITEMSAPIDPTAGAGTSDRDHRCSGGLAISVIGAANIGTLLAGWAGKRFGKSGSSPESTPVAPWRRHGSSQRPSPRTPSGYSPRWASSGWHRPPHQRLVTSTGSVHGHPVRDRVLLPQLEAFGVYSGGVLYDAYGSYTTVWWWASRWGSSRP